MNEGTITVRYAKALYQVGEESGQLNQIKDDVVNLLLIAEESIEFGELLESPIIKTSEKISVFKTLFEGKLHETIFRFFELLAENKREQFLPDMCRSFLHRFKEKQGIKEAIMTTAQPLEDKYSKEILAFLTKKFKLKIELTQKVNPDIIGGFKLRIDDQQIDASISSKLKKIQNELINA